MNPRYGYGTSVRVTIVCLGLLVTFSHSPGAASAQQKEKIDKNTGILPAPEDVNFLSMEVNALRTLYLLRGTDPDLTVGTQNPVQRLTILKKVFSTCAQKEDGKREPADVSDAYKKVLVDLRAALIAEQNDRIEELDGKLQSLQKDEEPDLDDRVEITDEARPKAAMFVKLHCTADQVTSYLASYGKDLPNAKTLLYTAMRVKPKGPNGKKPTPEEWKQIRSFTIREVTWMVGGLKIAKGDTIGMRVGDLLDKAYALSEDELKKDAQKLRNEANAIVNTVGPTDLIKHVIEQDIADMLSNSRLIPAVEARLKYLAWKEKK